MFLRFLKALLPERHAKDVRKIIQAEDSSQSNIRLRTAMLSHSGKYSAKSCQRIPFGNPFDLHFIGELKDASFRHSKRKRRYESRHIFCRAQRIVQE
jgi:hypothetical protein